jgi:hypothetical protein
MQKCKVLPFWHAGFDALYFKASENAGEMAHIINITVSLNFGRNMLIYLQT